MRTDTPQIVEGKPVRSGKVKIICPHCGLEHTLTPGLRVPPCGSDRDEYIVKGNVCNKET